jgi:hypothetical protein
MWPLGERSAHLLGLLRAIGKFLARTFVHHDRDHRGQEIAVLAGDRRICQRKHEQGQRNDARHCAAAAADNYENRDCRRNCDRRPQ